jgi:hypothetical protein
VTAELNTKPTYPASTTVQLKTVVDFERPAIGGITEWPRPGPPFANRATRWHQPPHRAREEPAMEHDTEALEEARRHVRRKRTFYIVLGVWIALCVMWFVIDMTDDSSSIWFYWPMFGSGIAVAITGIVLLGIGGLFGIEWERREIDKYLRRRGNERGP